MPLPVLRALHTWLLSLSREVVGESRGESRPAPLPAGGASMGIECDSGASQGARAGSHTGDESLSRVATATAVVVGDDALSVIRRAECRVLAQALELVTSAMQLRS